jgi:hypothetical protein
VKKRVRDDARYVECGLGIEDKERLARKHQKELGDKRVAAFRKLIDEAPGLRLDTQWAAIKDSLRSDPRYEKFSRSSTEVWTDGWARSPWSMVGHCQVLGFGQKTWSAWVWGCTGLRDTRGPCSLRSGRRRTTSTCGRSRRRPRSTCASCSRRARHVPAGAEFSCAALNRVNDNAYICGLIKAHSEGQECPRQRQQAVYSHVLVTCL